MHCLKILTAGAVLIATFTTAHAEEFTVVALPDTQCYSAGIKGGLPEMFTAQTNWIDANQADRNIKYVAHLGDVVQNQDDLTQWSNAKHSMSPLENSGVAFGTCSGNHDTHYGADGAKDHAATHYVANFGPNASYGSTGQTYADQPWYRGASPSGRSNYQVVPAGDYEFLFLNLSIDCPDEELTWAQGVLDANRDKPTVFSTHRHLYDFKMAAGYYGDEFTGRPEFDHAGLANESYYREADGTIRTTWPEDLETDFVRANRQIFMVLSGHYHAQYHQTVTNDFGLPVMEVLTDYQDGPLGGAAWMRAMDINTETGEIQFETFSPYLDRDRAITDDFAETLILVSLYKEFLAPQLPGMEGVDPTTPEGKAAVAAMVAGFQPDLDDQTNPEIAALLAGLAQLDDLDPSAREAQDLYPVWAAYDEVRNYVETYHPQGAAAWDADGDWDGLWSQVFAPGLRDPAFSHTVNFDSHIIPEPTTLALLAIGGLAARRRRRTA